MKQEDRSGLTIMIGGDGKAKVYDDTYDVTIHCETKEEQDACIERLKQDRWIAAEEPPKDDSYVLLSFENFSVPLVGRYEEDGGGGVYYVGDDDVSCIGQDIVVNAWRPLPDPYREEA